MKSFSKPIVLFLPFLIAIACTVSINNVWKVPNTNLEIAVEKKQIDTAKDEYERRMILRENHLDKMTVKLAVGINDYTKVDVFQIGEDRYLLKDAFEEYILDTKSNTLTKTTSGTLSQTFENTSFPKKIGSFTDDKNGNWRFVPNA